MYGKHTYRNYDLKKSKQKKQTNKQKDKTLDTTTENTAFKTDNGYVASIMFIARTLNFKINHQKFYFTRTFFLNESFI